LGRRGRKECAKSAKHRAGTPRRLQTKIGIPVVQITPPKGLFHTLPEQDLDNNFGVKNKFQKQKDQT